MMKNAGKVFMGVMISVFIGMGWSVPVSAGTAMAAECSHEAGSILLNHQEEEKLICREEDERIVNAGETKGDRQGRMAH